MFMDKKGYGNNRQSKDKQIWIDLENSPHVLFFNPIIKELQRRNIDVVVTARDYAQVCDLAKLFNLNYIKIGRHHGKHSLFKVWGTFARSFKLFLLFRRKKPSLAFSHGSRSQVITAKIAGIPSLVAFDYENTRKLPLITPTKAIVPEVLYKEIYKQRGNELLSYPGIKEDVYIPDFEPESSIIKKLNLKNDQVIVTIRPAATMAHYHNPKSDELFEAIIKFLTDKNNCRIIILPRTKDQAKKIRQGFPYYFNSGKIEFLKAVVNGLNLIWFSDLVISGGGTMIREATAMNVPAYSFFQGKIGAVDDFLASSGRMVLLNTVEDVKKKIKVKKKNNGHPFTSNRTSLNRIVDLVEEMVNRK